MRIDVIIPAYNAHDTIFRTLCSIGQQTLREDLDVTIVNDCSEMDYSEFVKSFSPYFSIKEICLAENSGPGRARQAGMDSTKNPLITFIDADDTFSSAFSLELLRAELLKDHIFKVCAEGFLEEHDDFRFVMHRNDFVWVFGKLYRRDFLEKYNIRFNDTRANEDNGFNSLIKLCTSEREQIKFISDTVYYWHMREDSITRINDCEYSYNQSFTGYTDNMIYAIREARAKKPENEYIKRFAAECMCNLYEYWIETCARDRRFAEQNMESCKKFYNEVFKDMEGEISEENFSLIYSEIMRNASLGGRLTGIIPEMSINEFMNILKKEDKHD